MIPSDEELAAFADGELDAQRARIVEAKIAENPALAKQVAAHKALRNRLEQHFERKLDDDVPEHLARLVRTHAQATAPRPRIAHFARSTWGWMGATALAASVALAVVLTGTPSSDLASGRLASALDNQLVATQPDDAAIRILLSFKEESGAICRVYGGSDESGIACRADDGWKIRLKGEAGTRQSTEFQMASSGDASLFQRAQEMAAGPALSASEELDARSNGWEAAR